jgi:hypothetical protein
MHLGDKMHLKMLFTKKLKKGLFLTQQNEDVNTWSIMRKQTSGKINYPR